MSGPKIPKKPEKPIKPSKPSKDLPKEVKEIDIRDVEVSGAEPKGAPQSTPERIEGIDKIVRSIAQALNTARLEATKTATKKVIEVGKERVEIQSFLDLEEAEVEIEIGVEQRGDVLMAKMAPMTEGPRARLRMVFRLREEEV